ncbi:hypothetical protein L6164_028417 [Bauhinia variegata]|uniref:Uncharacterized protein n=1 Tax=Bauhinia variegata TaxID=167791 RepID=A0ACB9L6G3_BAUVA|nr:hypothetical protein L6164_028417 [Bauhinia variegata]
MSSFQWRSLFQIKIQSYSRLMVHGPCKAINFHAPCMKDGKCKKYFPKKWHPYTTIEQDGKPTYRRRDNGITIEKMVCSLTIGM